MQVEENFCLKKIRDVVWLQTSYIGDIVLNTGSMHFLQKKIPGIRQHVITTPIGSQILESLSFVKTLIPFHKKKEGIKAFSTIKQQTLKAIADKKTSVIIQVHRSLRSSLLAKYIGLPIITYQESIGAFFAEKKLPRLAVFHETVRQGLLLEALGISREEILQIKPCLEQFDSLKLTPGFLRGVKNFQNGGKIIALAPGSVWGTKRWTPEGFQGLMARLVESTKLQIIVIGSHEEESLAEKICGQMPKQRVFNLAGKTSIPDLKWLFSCFSLLVSNDSSPIHFASAFGVPTVALFGATVPEMGFAPLAPKSLCLGIALDCRPCSDHGPQTCPLGHFRCMRELSVEKVYDACIKILETIKS